MRRRGGSSVFTPSCEQWSGQKASESDKSIADFQAAQAEKSAMMLLNVVRILMVCWMTMIACHIMFSGLELGTLFRALPRVLLRIFLFGNKAYLQEQMKRYPITVASVVQCVGHVTAVYGMVALSLDMPEGLLQHRAFLGQFLPLFMGAAATMYVPMRVFLMFVCPLYFAGWMSFHAAVDFVTVPCVVWALFICGIGIYIRHFQTLSLWREFQAAHALQKESQLLQARQESFQGIVSSVFDASCICDRNGQLKEFSSHLQELLALPDITQDAERVFDSEEVDSALDLCSFAATDVEAVRLANFLACALSCSRNQASKIRCSFRRGGSSPPEVIDLCMYASILQNCTPCQGGVDMLLVVFEVQSSILTRHTLPEDGIAQSTKSTTSGSLDDSLPQSPSLHEPRLDVEELSLPVPTEQRCEQEEAKHLGCSCSIFSLSDSLPSIPPNQEHGCTTCGATSRAFILPEQVSMTSLAYSPAHAGASRNLSVRAMVTVTAQTESDLLNLQDASCQTAFVCARPPKLPKVQDAQRRVVNQNRPTPSCSSLADSSLRSSRPTGSSAGTINSQSCAESCESSVEILIGGGDCQSSWSRSLHGQWERLALPSAGIAKVLLSDFMALPKNSKGQPTSFGSLQHFIEGSGCKPCPLYRKHRACRSGRLCYHCHADHDFTHRPPRKLSPQSASSMVKSPAETQKLPDQP